MVCLVCHLLSVEIPAAHAFNALKHLCPALPALLGALPPESALNLALRQGLAPACNHGCMQEFICFYVVPFEAVLQISAVVAFGWAEGLSHVNVCKVYIITWWWIGSLIPICLTTAALMAQGMAMARWCVRACMCV